jgi:hypothetical protein
MGVMAKSRKQKYDKICDIKGKTTIEELCRGYPHEFMDYFQDVRGLRFTDQPNYSAFRKLFRELFVREGFVYDYKYDWCTNVAATTPLTSLTPKVLTGNDKLIPPFTATVEAPDGKLRLNRHGKCGDESRPPFTASPGLLIDDVAEPGHLAIPVLPFVTPRLKRNAYYGRKLRIDMGFKKTTVPRWISTRGVGFVTR